MVPIDQTRFLSVYCLLTLDRSDLPKGITANARADGLAKARIKAYSVHSRSCSGFFTNSPTIV
jgi:hypothetical protein